LNEINKRQIQNAEKKLEEEVDREKEIVSHLKTFQKVDEANKHAKYSFDGRRIQ